MEELPAPGSAQAALYGCICSAPNNNYGKGIVSQFDGHTYWELDSECPYHVPLTTGLLVDISKTKFLDQAEIGL